MDKRRRNIIILAVTMLLLLFILFRFGGRGGYSWSENYLADNRGPYGTDVIRQLLQDYYPAEAFTLMEDSIDLAEATRTGQPANYVFIGASQYLDSLSMIKLFDFIGLGNRAFIISRSLADELVDHINLSDCYGNYFWEGYEEYRDTAISVRVDQGYFAADTTVQFAYQYRNQVRNYNWQYIDDSYFCDEDGKENITPLGTFEGLYTNFARLKYGEGVLYLHTNPILFSNYALLEEKRLPYVEAVFSNTVEGPIYWDEYSKVPGFLRNPRFSKRISDRSPLDYILRQPPLAWAWYLLLVMAGLYLLFRTKRRQRIIPVLEKNHNTSLDFLQTIGHLYFAQNDHRKIALHKSRLFLSFIRERYGLATQELGEPFTRQLSAKSEIPRAEIDKILLLNKNIQTSSFVSEKILINFHQKIEAFYKNCK